eukprot:jgi/Tetstr1/436099/TSEL_024947.t1
MSQALGRAMPVPGTDALVAPSPQGLAAVLLAPVAGFCATADIVMFLLMIGGFMATITRTGAIDAGIGRAMSALRGREALLIPILMTLFCAGGTAFGMAEETIPFYGILIPVMVRAGYDSITAVSIVMLGAGLGVLGSTLNPFATIVACKAAGVPLVEGVGPRLVVLGLSWAAGVAHVYRYAAAVKADPAASLLAGQQSKEIAAPEAAQVDTAAGGDAEAATEMSGKQAVTLGIFAATFVVLIYGVALAGWEMCHMSALFFASSIAVAVLHKHNDEDFWATMVRGGSDLLGVAFILALASGIVKVMNDGMITDIVLSWMVSATSGLSSAMFINVAYWVQVLLSLLIPCSSGLAMLTMPIMSPLADFSGVARHLLVTSFQCASGIVNLMTPTSGVLMGALAIGKIPYTTWVRFVAPLLLQLSLITTVVLNVSVVIDSEGEETAGDNAGEAAGGFKFPTAYSTLLGLIALVAVATWVIPAGEYERVMSQALGRTVPVPGTYAPVAPSPQGLAAVLLAPIAGFYATSDITMFLLMIGGFLATVTRTGAIDAGIGRAVSALRGREPLLIPILMTLFCAGGTAFGMAEETIPFYGILIPVMVRAGYDSLTAVGIVMLGAGLGVLGSTLNPFATIVACKAAGVPLVEGLGPRLAVLGLSWAAGVAHVYRYAAAVKADPAASLLAGQQSKEIAAPEAAQVDTAAGGDAEAATELSGKQAVTLGIFAATFVVLIYGVALAGWEMCHMSALFFASTIAVAVLHKRDEEDFWSTLVRGGADLLGVAFVVALARGIVTVMNDGMITDTVLSWMASATSGLSSALFINAAYWLQVLLSLLIPSSSGLATLTMPIMSPLADFSGAARHLLVTAFQCASGMVNLMTPTSGVLMGALAIGKIPYTTWVRFVAPLLLQLALIATVVLNVSAVM